MPPEFTKRFEYKLSFKGPHLVFKDGTIPFWEHSGSAIPSNDQIRITPSIKSQKGRIWSRNAIAAPDWEIEVIMRVNGRGRIGADGMAIWFTDKIGVDGPVFGSNDQWNGLGIFLDSFDNDGQQNNPYISVMINDGTKQFDHHRDGITQQIGGCLRDFRNKPFPIRIRVEYFRKTLTVSYHAGLSNDLSQYEICTQVLNIDLPKQGHFGVSAATGGLADDHDVLAFITHSYFDHKNTQVHEPSKEEQTKYDKEYEQFMKQLEEEKQKYQKDHPDQVQNIPENKVFENENEKEYKSILEAQSQMHQLVRSLDSKVSEILGRQTQMVSLLSSNTANTGVGAQQQQQIHQNQIPSADTFKREEINHLFNIQNDLLKQIRDIYASVTDVHRKTNDMHDRARANPSGPAASAHQAAAPSNLDPSMIQQINDGVKNLKFEITTLLNRNQPRCPEMTQNCLPTNYFLLLIAIQTIVFIGYFLYKNRSESHSKKFY